MPFAASIIGSGAIDNPTIHHQCIADRGARWNISCSWGISITASIITITIASAPSSILLLNIPRNALYFVERTSNACETCMNAITAKVIVRATSTLVRNPIMNAANVNPANSNPCSATRLMNAPFRTPTRVCAA